MNPILMAVDDGLTDGNFNAADIFFLIALVLGALSGIAYVSGFVGPAVEPGAVHPNYRYSRWAAALLSFAVAAVGFGLFLL